MPDSSKIMPRGIKYIPSNPIFIQAGKFGIGSKPISKIENRLTEIQQKLIDIASGKLHKSSSQFNISGYMMGSTYDAMPQEALEQFRHMISHGPNIVSYDIETLGILGYDPKRHRGLNVYMPTEITMKRFKFSDVGEAMPIERLGSKITRRPLGDLIETGEGISFMLKPSKARKTSLMQLIEKAERMDPLTAAERRSLIDLMKYSRERGGLNNTRLFDAPAQLQEATFTNWPKTRKHRPWQVVKPHQAVLDMGDMLYDLSPTQFKSYVSIHSRSGLETLEQFGVPEGLGKRWLSEFLQKYSNDVYVGANIYNFDQKVLQGLGIAVPQRQLDMYQFLRTTYPISPELHRVLGAKGETYALEALYSSMTHGQQQFHTSAMDVDIIPMMFNRHLDAFTSRYESTVLTALRGDKLTPGYTQYIPADIDLGVKVGSKLYSYRGFFAGDDPYNVMFERTFDGEIIKSYGGTLTNKRAIYEVTDMWTSNLNNQQLFGINLYDSVTQRSVVMAAESEAKLAAKIQSFAVNADVMEKMYGAGILDKITRERVRDTARQYWKSAYDVGGGPRSGINFAERLYRAAHDLRGVDLSRLSVDLATAQWSEADRELISRLSEYGIRTPTQLRHFMALRERLESEADVMLDAIGRIKAGTKSGAIHNANVAWLTFNNMLDPHETVLDRALNFNVRGINVYNRYLDGPSFIDLTTRDTAMSSIFSMVNANMRAAGDRIKTQQQAEAFQKRYMREIMQELNEQVVTFADGTTGPALPAKDLSAILQNQEMLTQATMLAEVLSSREIAMPEERTLSLARRVIKSGGTPVTKENVHEVIQRAINASSMVVDYRTDPKDVATIIMDQLTERNLYRQDERLEIATLARKLYDRFTRDSIGVAFTLEGDALQMVMYSPEHAETVVRSLVEGRHTAHAISVPFPVFDKYGNIKMRKRLGVLGIDEGMSRFKPTIVIKDYETGRFIPGSPLDVMANEISRMHRYISKDIAEGDLGSAIRRVSMAMGDTVKRLSGASEWLRPEDIDTGIISTGRNIGHVIRSKDIILDELAQEILSTQSQSPTKLSDIMGSRKAQFYARDLRAYVAQHHPDLLPLIDKISYATTRSNQLSAGKVSTLDVRELHVGGFYTPTTRENLAQFQNYYSLERSRFMHDEILPGSLILTEKRLETEQEVRTAFVGGKEVLEEHVTGASTYGMLLDDFQVNQLFTEAKQRVEQDLRRAAPGTPEHARLMQIARELDTEAITPRVYESQAIITKELSDVLHARAAKTYRLDPSLIPEETLALIERAQAGEQPRITADTVFMQGTTPAQTVTFDRAIYGGGGNIVRANFDPTSNQWIVHTSYDLPFMLGSKAGVEAEKVTAGWQPSMSTLQYMLNTDVPVHYIHFTEQAKASHADVNAYIAGMLNRAGYEYQKAGRVQEFIDAVEAEFGFKPRYEQTFDEYGRRFIIPNDLTPVGGGNILDAMERLYNRLGMTEKVTIGTSGNIEARLEFNEIRRMITDENLYASTVTGQSWPYGGGGIQFGPREWKALADHNLIYRDSSNRLRSGNLTAFGTILQQQIESAPMHQEYKAQAIGQWQTIKRIMEGIEPGDNLRTVSEFRAIAPGLGGIHRVEDIAGTIFDPRITKDGGFYLHLGTDIDVNLGPAMGGVDQYRRISSIFIGPQVLNYVPEQGYSLGDREHRTLANLFTAVSELTEKTGRMSDLSDAELANVTQLRANVATNVRKYLDDIVASLQESKGTTFSHVLGGKLPMSVVSKGQILSPLEEAGKSVIDTYISADIAEKLFGDLSRTIDVPEDIFTKLGKQAGESVTLRELLTQHGMYDTIVRFPNIHESVQQITRLKITDEFQGPVAMLNAVVAGYLNMDTDGDIISNRMAFTANINPFTTTRQENRELFWTAQRELESRLYDRNYAYSVMNRQQRLDEILDDLAGRAAKPSDKATLMNVVKHYTSQDVEQDIAARVGRETIGVMSNLAFKLRELAAQHPDWTPDSAQYKHIGTLTAALEQSNISSKLQSGGIQFLKSLEALSKSFKSSQFDPESIKQLMADIDIKLPADQIDDILASTSELLKTMGSQLTMPAMDIGVSKGITSGPAAFYHAMTDTSSIIPTNKLYLAEAVDPGLASTLADVQFRPRTSGRPVQHMAQEILEKTTEQMVDVKPSTLKGFSSALDSLGEGTKAGLGLLGAFGAITLAIRMVSPRDTLVRDEDVSHPQALPTYNGQQITMVEERAPQGLNVRMRVTGQTNGEEVARNVNQAIQSTMPNELRTTVTVRDYSQNFDRDFLSNLFSELLG